MSMNFLYVYFIIIFMSEKTWQEVLCIADIYSDISDIPTDVNQSFEIVGLVLSHIHSSNGII